MAATRASTAGAGATRDRLLRAAERLIAENGIDAVSLREITRAAGARNATALQYHFGDRGGLVRAVLAPHHRDVEAGRHALLDAYDADHPDPGHHDPGHHDPGHADPGRADPGGADTGPSGPDGDLAALAGALVRPPAAKLADASGGPEYLQIIADLLERPRPAISPASLEDPADSMFRWRALVAPLLAPEAVLLHRRFAAYRFMAAELAQRARSGPHADDRLFTSDLVDLVTALLAAPLSPSTKRLHAGRRTSGRRSG